MVWVAVGLVFLFLMLRFPAFGGLVLIAAAVGGLYLYAESERSSAIEERERVLASSVERLSLIKFTGEAGLRLDGYLSRIVGVAINTSAHLTVHSFKLKVLVYDCPDRAMPNCTVVGEDEETIYVVIPPNQKRAFDQSLSFANMPRMAENTWSWTFILREVRAS